MKKIIITFLFASSLFSADYRISGPPERILGGDGQSFIQPVWSPDGAKLAYTSRGYRGIWIYDLVDENLVSVSDEIGAGFGFAWSPDGRSIAMRTAKYDGPFRIHTIKVYNSLNNDTRIIKEANKRIVGLPKWTRDNSSLYYLDGEQLEIIAINKTISAKKQSAYLCSRGDKILRTSIEQTEDKSWSPVTGKDILNLKLSPDAQKITFEVLGGNLFVQNVDGSGLIDFGRGYNASWSPDGAYLVFMMTTDDGHEYLESDLFIARTADGERYQLTDTPELLEMNPCWSPDGTVIAYDEYTEGAIYLLPIEK